MLTIFYAPFFLFPVELYKFAFPMSELMLLITAAAWAAACARRLGAQPPERRRISRRSHSGRSLTPLDYGVAALAAARRDLAGVGGAARRGAHRTAHAAA